VLQTRFGSDFAPIASIGFALLLGEFRNVLPRAVPRPVASSLARLAGAGRLWPGAMATYLRKAPEATSRFFRSGEPPSAGYVNPSHALVDFLRMVRRVTPETSGYFDPEETPEYGILIHPGYGHAMSYVGRRPTPANNFASYLDAGKYESVLRFFRSPSVREALAIADRLSVRYVVTRDHQTLRPGEFEHLLHRHDGSWRFGWTHAERLRLIIEGPEGGLPLQTSFPRGARPGVVPYKLFEVVKGAVFEVRGDPGTPIRAEVSVVTPTLRVPCGRPDRRRWDRPPAGSVCDRDERADEARGAVSGLDRSRGGSGAGDGRGRPRGGTHPAHGPLARRRTRMRSCCLP
jgi:hypothetical protein